MRLPGWFAIHRWAGFAGAFFLFAWIVSGVVLLLPGSTAAPPSAQQRTSLPAADMTVSPAEAIATVEQSSDGRPAPMRSMTLHRVGERPAYRIALEDGSIRLVDARTGEEFGITRELAVRIATDAYPTADVQRVERLDTHGPTYLYGVLPAFRVTFDDGAGTWAHVSGTDGALFWTNRSRRIRQGIVAFHEFSFLPVLPGGDELRWLLLIVGVVASSVVLASGVYLFYAWWIRSRRAGV